MKDHDHTTQNDMSVEEQNQTVLSDYPQRSTLLSNLMCFARASHVFMEAKKSN